MNKAFVREPDEPDDLHCPRCGSLGHAVSAATIAALLREGVRCALGSNACFCGNANCDAVYFDGSEQVILAAQLGTAVYPKDVDAPICACFGLKAEDVMADAKAGNPAGVRMLIEKSKTQQDQCAVLAASGRCCVDEVQRVYLKAAAQSRSR